MMKTNLDNIQRNFILDEIWVLTFGGAFQRSNIYKEDTTAEKKSIFKNTIRKHIEGLIKDLYSKKNEINLEERHINNIKWLSDTISNEFKDILRNTGMNIGISQKILNLHLKYLWCLGMIETPPHCPFDRIIISKLDMANSEWINWTSLNNIEDYKKLVGYAKLKAKEHNISIAERELSVFNRRN